MSATILKDNVIAEAVKLLNLNGQDMMNLRYRPAQGATVNGAAGTSVGAGVIPAVSAEEIGLRAAELAAERRGMMQVIGIVEEQHRVLVAPEVVEAPAANGNAAERPEPVY